MPTYSATAAFYRMLRRLTKAQQKQFFAARDLFVTELQAHGFAPPLHPALRLHKLSGHDVWSISLGDGIRAVWEFIGTHDEYTRAY